jgi:hypothetical protein
MGKKTKHQLKARAVPTQHCKQAERRARKEAGSKRGRQAGQGRACNYSSREEQQFASMLHALGLRVKVVPGACVYVLQCVYV